MSNVKLENLEINGYMIYQDKDSFNFGIDAVLLANFALRRYSSVNKTSNVSICDFCTGTLPIPLIMYAKRQNFLGEKVNFSAFEIDKEQVDLCNKSILYNKESVSDAKDIDKDIRVYNDDIKNIINDKDKYKNLFESFDVVTVNPPYTKKGSGLVNENDKKVIARHEIFITFDEICKAANLLLKPNKKFYIIHHSERFTELCETLKKNFFEAKFVQFIHPSIDKKSNLCLIEAVKNANPGVTIMEPIIIYEKDGNYTESVLQIYGK